MFSLFVSLSHLAIAKTCQHGYKYPDDAQPDAKPVRSNKTHRSAGGEPSVGWEHAACVCPAAPNGTRTHSVTSSGFTVNTTPSIAHTRVKRAQQLHLAKRSSCCYCIRPSSLRAAQVGNHHNLQLTREKLCRPNKLSHCGHVQCALASPRADPIEASPLERLLERCPHRHGSRG
jgi:hypothetical protein